MSDPWRWPGARWWKFDFHTHTPASVDYGKGPNQCQLRQITPKEWLLGFMRAGVDCVAVTDHNTGEWIDPLKEALSGVGAGSNTRSSGHCISFPEWNCHSQRQYSISLQFSTLIRVHI